MDREALDLAPLVSQGRAVVDAIGPRSVERYIQIRRTYLETNVSESPDFQSAFRLFYRLDNAGLTPEFKDQYFELMEAARDSAPNLRSLALALYAFPNRKGQRSLQFSFVTKLANTIDPTCPIYDSWVAALCGFRPPMCGLEVEDRIDRLLEFHGWLGKSYDQALSAGAIGGMIDRFRRIYSANDEMVPEAKVVDFICWSAGRMRLKLPGWCPQPAHQADAHDGVVCCKPAARSLCATRLASGASEISQ
jgi:hypothetical protein